MKGLFFAFVLVMTFLFVTESKAQCRSSVAFSSGFSQPVFFNSGFGTQFVTQPQFFASPVVAFSQPAFFASPVVNQRVVVRRGLFRRRSVVVNNVSPIRTRIVLR